LNFIYWSIHCDCPPLVPGLAGQGGGGGGDDHGGGVPEGGGLQSETLYCTQCVLLSMHHIIAQTPQQPTNSLKQRWLEWYHYR
jgi:hypothetical protein